MKAGDVEYLGIGSGGATSWTLSYGILKVGIRVTDVYVPAALQV